MTTLQSAIVADRIRRFEERGVRHYLLSHARNEWSCGNNAVAMKDLSRLSAIIEAGTTELRGDDGEAA